MRSTNSSGGSSLYDTTGDSRLRISMWRQKSQDGDIRKELRNEREKMSGYEQEYLDFDPTDTYHTITQRRSSIGTLPYDGHDDDYRLIDPKFNDFGRGQNHAYSNGHGFNSMNSNDFRYYDRKESRNSLSNGRRKSTASNSTTQLKVHSKNGRAANSTTNGRTATVKGKENSAEIPPAEDEELRKLKPMKLQFWRTKM